jgi:hypothetical protein
MARAKPKTLIHGDLAVTPNPEPRAWAKAHGTYISGRAYLDEADKWAADMESKWGCGQAQAFGAARTQGEV